MGRLNHEPYHTRFYFSQWIVPQKIGTIDPSLLLDNVLDSKSVHSPFGSMTSISKSDSLYDFSLPNRIEIELIDNLIKEFENLIEKLKLNSKLSPFYEPNEAGLCRSRIEQQLNNIKACKENEIIKNVLKVNIS